MGVCLKLLLSLAAACGAATFAETIGLLHLRAASAREPEPGPEPEPEPEPVRVLVALNSSHYCVHLRGLSLILPLSRTSKSLPS